MKSYLLRVEGVNFSDFMFDTQDLSTIRGGSFMLRDVVQHLPDLTSGYALKPVTTGASTGIYVFEADGETKAEEVRTAAAQALQGTLQLGASTCDLRYATFVVDFVEATDNFVFDRECLRAKNHFRQWHQPTLAIPNRSNSPSRACVKDLVRPGLESMTGPKGEEKVSASVKVRRQYGRDQKRRFYQDLTGVEGEFVQSFEELTEDPANPLRRKMAVIHIDGNGFGALQDKHCTTIETQRRFDKYIQDRRKDMLKSFLETVVMTDRRGWQSDGGYRVETLLWGGDEITMVVPAWKGWETLRFFYDQARDWAFEREVLTHAAGIVFCHHNAPINRIRNLAESLVSLAKKIGGHKRNLFAYQVLESFDDIGGDIDLFRKQRCPRGCSPAELILPAETMKAAEGILPSLRESVPKGKLHKAVYASMKDAGTAGEIFEELEKAAGESAMDSLRTCFGTNDAMLWLHVLELWDYVSPGKPR